MSGFEFLLEGEPDSGVADVTEKQSYALSNKLHRELQKNLERGGSYEEQQRRAQRRYRAYELKKRIRSGNGSSIDERELELLLDHENPERWERFNYGGRRG